jgi:predicted transcriptional regulator
MDTEIHIGIGMISYIVYNVVLNWMYIKEYIKGMDKGVIRRGNEWPD